MPSPADPETGSGRVWDLRVESAQRGRLEAGRALQGVREERRLHVRHVVQRGGEESCRPAQPLFRLGACAVGVGAEPWRSKRYGGAGRRLRRHGERAREGVRWPAVRHGQAPSGGFAAGGVQLKRADTSDESETSEDSDIDSEASSALFMTKKKTPPKKERKGSASSSQGNSRPGTPLVDAGTSSTLRAAANKLELGKRQAGSSELPAAKRLKLDAGPQASTTSGKSTPQPQSGKSTPSSGDVQLTEDAVRRYLTRKPMTTKDLLKKFQTKKTGLSSEQTVNVLAQILKRLNPERKNINDKMHFFLKE